MTTARPRYRHYGTTAIDECISPKSAPPNTTRHPAKPPTKPSRKPLRKTQPSKSANATPHKLIERRYRYRLQSEIDNLTSKVPAWELDASSAITKTTTNIEIDIEDSDHPLAAKKRSKASAIAAAAKHLEHLERDNEKKANFIRNLQEQIEGLQKLVRCDECPILRCWQSGGNRMMVEVPSAAGGALEEQQQGGASL
jgi:hypothetical protein